MNLVGRPSLQFEEGIEKTVQWYLENQNGWMQLRVESMKKYYEMMYFDMN